MPRLVSRFAEGVFWLGRYIERTEAVARILDITKSYAGSDQDNGNWLRVLRLFGDAQRFAESGRTPDAASVLAFYLHDRDNPTSVAYAVARAHDNARGARHLISTEMWTHLNILRHQQEALTLRDMRLPHVSALCQKIKTDCQTFEGIVEGTLTRGDVWLFYQIGKFIERADQTTRVLDIGYTSLWSGEEEALISVRWNTLVRSLAGYHAYRATYPAGRYARDVANFLLYDEDFVRAVAFCMTRVSRGLEELAARQQEPMDPAIRENLDSIAALMAERRQQKLSPAQMSEYLDVLQGRFLKLGQVISERYF